MRRAISCLPVNLRPMSAGPKRNPGKGPAARRRGRSDLDRPEGTRSRRAEFDGRSMTRVPGAQELRRRFWRGLNDFLVAEHPDLPEFRGAADLDHSAAFRHPPYRDRACLQSPQARRGSTCGSGGKHRSRCGRHSPATAAYDNAIVGAAWDSSKWKVALVPACSSISPFRIFARVFLARGLSMAR